MAAVGALFLALGVWQLERRVWKQDLIRRVETRVQAAPVAPPARDRWSAVDAAGDEYRRVRLVGRWIDGATARAYAVTRLGPGCWVLDPLRLDGDGGTVWVNRGFIDDDRCRTASPPPAPPVDAVAEVVGLLRISEPGGGFLRRNDPAAGRWFSRDVAALTAAARLPGPVAPFFVDAEAGVSSSSSSSSSSPSPSPAPSPAASPSAVAEPVGGLTVVAFRDHHAIYAATWFALSALCAYAVRRLWRAGAPTGRTATGPG